MLNVVACRPRQQHTDNEIDHGAGDRAPGEFLFDLFGERSPHFRLKERPFPGAAGGTIEDSVNQRVHLTIEADSYKPESYTISGKGPTCRRR